MYVLVVFMPPTEPQLQCCWPVKAMAQLSPWGLRLCDTQACWGLGLCHHFLFQHFLCVLDNQTSGHVTWQLGLRMLDYGLCTLAENKNTRDFNETYPLQNSACNSFLNRVILSIFLLLHAVYNEWFFYVRFWITILLFRIHTLDSMTVVWIICKKQFWER